MTNIYQNPKPHRGRKFRELRHRAGLSLQALAAVTGVDPSTISRWESRKEFTQFKRFVQTLHRLGTTPERFLGLEEDEAESEPASRLPEYDAIGAAN
jgi:transcriptional regulator with XRE-family HTH domain